MNDYTTEIVMMKTVVKDLHLVRGCIQKFPDRPPGVRTVNGTVLCH